MTKIDNWSVVNGNSSPYNAPETQWQALSGNITGHPKLGKLDGITTSRIVGWSLGMVLTKSGTNYELGEVDPAYELLFPNARERLMNSLKDIK